jgi:hypothetical protein
LDTRELAVTTRELESKNRTISELETKNLRLAENDSQMRRKMEDTNRLLLSSKAEVEELRASLNNQTDTIEKLGDQMSSLTPRNGEEVGIIVEKPNEMPVIEQFDMLQDNPESLNFQTRETILTTESLSNEIPAENQELDEAPAEEPVSEPIIDIPVEVRPSNQQLGMDEKKTKPESLPEIIDDIENMSNKDPVLGKTEVTEITKETIIPEESDQVEEQPSKVQSNKSTDNQFLHKPGDRQVLPSNSEKSQLPQKQNGAMDEKREEPPPLPVCEEGNQKPFKHFKIRFKRGVNLPKAKDYDKYYVSMRVEQCRGMNRVQDNKIKTKTIRGSQPEWNKDFTIKTHNPEECRMTIKVKKSSILGLKTSTVGFVKLDLSSLDDGINKLQLYDKSYNPVGKACLEVEITSSAKV